MNLDPRRAENIGASESPALLGDFPFQSLFRLFHEKRGELAGKNLDDDERIQAGQLFEPVIAGELAERNGWTIRRVPYQIHPTIKGMACSPDYEIVNHPDGPGFLEIKNVDRSIFFQRWVNQEPPWYVQSQLQHQLACNERRAWGAVGACIGGNDFRAWRYDRHAKLIAKIELSVHLFWEMDEPEPTETRDADTIAELFVSNAVDGTVYSPEGPLEIERMVQLARAYKTAGKLKGQWEQAQKEAKAKILAMMDTHAGATAGGWTVTTKATPETQVAYKKKAGRRFNVSPPKGFQIAAPDAAGELTDTRKDDE